MQYYSAKDTSLVKVPSNIVETYIPLWVADGAAVSTAIATPGAICLVNGGTPAGRSNTAANQQLFTLSPTWNASTVFAFEATTYGASGSQNASLWDMTSNSQVTSSQVSNSSVAALVTRSGQFTLIPGHSYGVTFWAVSANTAYIVDASLIVFG